MKVFQWHGDTYDLPHDATVLAKSDLYPQAFRIGSAIGIQFHIEVDEEMIRLWSEEYRNELVSEKIEPGDILPTNSDIDDLASKGAAVYRNFSAEIKARRKA